MWSRVRVVPEAHIHTNIHLPSPWSEPHIIDPTYALGAAQIIKRQGIMMDIVISIAAKVAEHTVAPVCHQLGYIFQHRNIVEKLNAVLQNLEAAKSSLQHSIDEAINNGEMIEEIVHKWSKKVDVTIAFAKEFQQIEGHAKVGCSRNSFPNLWTRHQLSRKASKMTKEITDMMTERNNFNKISYHPTLSLAIPPFARGYNALDSRASILSEILNALKDPNIYKIGLYGMGGVGKSTLVKELAWKAEHDESFDKVVVATVTISPDVKKIQQQVAEKLGMKLEEQSEDVRACRLRQRIKTENNILVILDNIWKKIDLIEIGIPHGDDHKGCKLLLTSRDLNVLNCDMDTDKDFKLEVLCEDESWILFQKTAGNVVEDYNIKTIALKVAQSCDGLPLSIVTVASALKKKSELSIWRNALQQLIAFDHEGMKSQVYPAIELSYNHLESEELKFFFLFIASMANGQLVNDVLRYSWGLGLFKNVNALEDARNRVYKLVADLRASCLLLEGTNNFLIMHDIIHEVASSIASQVQPFFSMPTLSELTEWPKTDVLQRCCSIFLSWCYIRQLPESLDCPELKFLCLNSEDNFWKVADNFFVGTRKLEVLDFGGFDCYPCPPSSLSHLTNLRALYLCKSMLDDITIVANLVNLEILSLDRSEIKKLPIELAQLIHLRVLDLSHCKGLTIIPSNLLSRLTCLEELYMGNSFIQWEVEGRKNQSNNASLGELRHLNHLTTLDLNIQHASVLPRDLIIFGKLERYNIAIGSGWNWLWLLGKSYENSRILFLNSSTTTNIHLDRGVKLLLNRVEELYLVKLKGIRNVLYQLCEEGFPQLKDLDIKDNDEIQYIIDSTEWANSSCVFPIMESLILQNLAYMKKVIHGMPPEGVFTKLKVIKVKGCSRLESLFLHSIVGNLSQLVEAEISQCNSLIAIINVDQGGDYNSIIEELKFPKLSSLTLDGLPMLLNFSRTYDAKYDDNVNIPLALFDKKIEFPNLGSLKISSINTRRIWVDQLSTYSCIQNLKKLTITSCDRLEFLFPSSVIRELVNLQHLEITRCGMLKEIFEQEDKMDNSPFVTEAFSIKEATFPSLETLIISKMDSLKSIWNHQLTPNSFCKLVTMEISFCKMLSNVFPCYELNNLRNMETLHVTDCATLEVVFEIQGQNTRNASQVILATQLKTLTLKSLPMLKHIWSGDPHGSIGFQNLSTVEVDECESLHHVFPITVSKQLLQLQVLKIEDCGVENIVAKDKTEANGPRFVFPQLTLLKFWYLPKLESWYPGIHTLDCPKLVELDVYHCDELEVFTVKSQNYQVDNPPNRQPLFFWEKVHNTEELSLRRENVATISKADYGDVDFCAYGQFSTHSLNLRCFHDESDQVPWDFIERFTNLENLALECSSFIQIFSTERKETVIKLRSLTLVYLTKLEYLCQENILIQPILHNLEKLILFFIPGLKNVFPSSVPLFQNLDTLMVGGCSGLVHITTLSTARSFTQLRELHIFDCEVIEEIVGNEEGDTGEVAFLKLERLELINSPNLKCFCNGKNKFKFPLLKVLAVAECKEMETFCHASLSTPNLEVIFVSKDKEEIRWEGDLNATIQKLFSEMNSIED
ncbi:hypothetical protein RIF29_30819 [Crotalaria pallida]|uniref:Uncharacterized protein n=1 Tax=Crotalaria pallida TaxID=3830 RepID=A0AAN9HUW4_CROPI